MQQAHVGCDLPWVSRRDAFGQRRQYLRGGDGWRPRIESSGEIDRESSAAKTDCESDLWRQGQQRTVHLLFRFDMGDQAQYARGKSHSGSADISVRTHLQPEEKSND